MHRLPSHNSGPRDAHDLSDASKPPRRKLHWHFYPKVWIRGAQFHGSQRKPSTFFDFWFAFLWFFRSRQIFLFPLSALWLQLDVLLVDPRFVACDNPFQEFNAFLWDFPVNATLFPPQLLLRSEKFRYYLGAKPFHFQMFRQNRVMDDFPKPSSSAIILTVNRRSLSMRKCTRSMFSLPLEVEGGPNLALSLGFSRHSRKCRTHLETVLSFRAYSP